MDYWMLPWEAAEPLRMITSPSAPHALSACICLIHLCSCWAWSRLWLHCSASAFWRDILIDVSCQREDEHCLGAREEIKTSGNTANPWSTFLVLLVDLTSRNAGSAERWSRTELSGSEEVFVLCLFWAGLTGGIILFVPLPVLQISADTCLPHSRYQQSGFLSPRPKNSAFSSRFNVNPCSNVKMSPWTSLEHKSFHCIEFCHGCEMLRSPVPLSCVELLVNLQLKAIQLTTL